MRQFDVLRDDIQEGRAAHDVEMSGRDVHMYESQTADVRCKRSPCRPRMIFCLQRVGDRLEGLTPQHRFSPDRQGSRGAAQHFADNPDSMPLEIAFQTRELRATCESPTKAKRALGEPGSKALRRVLADMNAVETVAELFDMGLEIENCTQEHGMLRFQLSEGLSLFCNVNQKSAPMNGETIDWAQVTRLKVARIGDGK